MFNFGDMMGKIREFQEKLKSAQEKLKEIEVTGESGGGMVRVTATAERKVVRIQVDPEIVDRNDTELMTDLITAAVNIALDNAEKRAKEEMSKITEGLPNIPGFDLGKMGIS